MLLKSLKPNESLKFTANLKIFYELVVTNSYNFLILMIIIIMCLLLYISIRILITDGTLGDVVGQALQLLISIYETGGLRWS